MKLALLRTKTFSNATAAGLDADILAFVDTLDEEQFVSLHFAFDGATFTALLAYTT